jgi:TetR/AcrR family transcriptional repressor of nem operon
MSEESVDQSVRRLTARGAATRARIVAAADELIRIQGVNGTTLDEVTAASGSSKSQLYRHFSDKEALVREVISLRAVQVLEREEQYLRRADSFRGLERWRRAVLQRVSLRNGAFGCELGSLSAELADQDDQARADLDRHFGTWESLLAGTFLRMRGSGTLAADAEPDELATGLMAALQGGYLLAQTSHSPEPMRIALDMAFAHIRTFATSTS